MVIFSEDHMTNDNGTLRVLQVVNYMDRGGLETMLMNYYRNIDRDRVQFDFLVHRSERAAYDDEIEKMGGRIYRIQRLVPWNRSYRKELANFFDTHREYQIVHVHRDCMSSVILKEANRHGVLVRIAHSHNSYQDKDLKYPIKLFYMRSIPKYATHLLACSAVAGDWMFGGVPYMTVKNAIDTKSFSFSPDVRSKKRAELGIDDKFVVGHVGRFMYVKNHSFLLDVFSSISKKRQNAILLLVGDGELVGEIKEKAKMLGIADKIVFLGVRSDVGEILSAMDVFVFPSIYEGLPLTLVEAQTSGLPCVVSDGVPAECAVTDDLVSLLPLSLGADAWADKILDASKMPRTDRSDEIRARGYDIKTEAHKLQDLYVNTYEHNKC